MSNQPPKMPPIRRAIAIATEEIARHPVEDDEDSLLRAFETPVPREEMAPPEDTLSSKTSSNTLQVQKLQAERQKLPVWKFKDKFLQLLKENQVVIVEGETGCGKTTQIPQWCVEYTEHKAAVACTQPRRLAASSIAQRVAEEMGVILGEEAGYHVRFDNCTSAKTYLTYMTDGILLRQLASNYLLREYGVILLDETHERGIFTDLLMGLLKEVIRGREDLRLVIMSATLDTEKFENYFHNPPILTIPGRLYRIDIFYEKRTVRNVVIAAVDKVKEIHQNETASGDILIFMSGQPEIDSICEMLEDWANSRTNSFGPLRVLPLYSDLAKEEQELVFEPPPPHNGCGVSRKVIVATNIAETSVTIDGIVFVIDSGFMNVKTYERLTRIEILRKVDVTKTNARQRSGRAGRTQPGKCFRLYTEETYSTKFRPYIIPEILRSNLSSLVLDMKSMAIKDVLNFNFMDHPDRQALLSAMIELRQLKALDEVNEITTVGSLMADFPVDPRIAKVLITSCTNYKCPENILTIAAMLSVPRCFIWSRRKRLQINEARKQFMSQHGDHIMMFKLYHAYRANGESRDWCRDNFVHYHNLKFAVSIRSQLKALLEHLNLYDETFKEARDPDYIPERQALLSGFCLQVAFKLEGTKLYRTLRETDINVEVHEMSGLTGEFPNFVIYHERLTVQKPYICTVTPIESKWWDHVVGEPVKDLLKLEQP